MHAQHETCNKTGSKTGTKMQHREQSSKNEKKNCYRIGGAIKAMDGIGVVMTPFGDVVTVILVVNCYVCRLILQSS